MRRRPAPLVNRAALIVAVVLGTAGVGAEQQPPPIQGVTGTIATEESVRDVHEGARGIAVGLRRLFRLNKRSTPDSSDEAAESLAGLTAGTAVSVHTMARGETLTAEALERDDQGLQQIEGVVTAVNRRERTISIRLADGTRQTLLLSDRAAAGIDTIDKDGEPGGGTARVIVFVKDEAGLRVVHYFKRVS